MTWQLAMDHMCACLAICKDEKGHVYKNRGTGKWTFHFVTYCRATECPFQS